MPKSLRLLFFQFLDSHQNSLNHPVWDIFKGSSSLYAKCYTKLFSMALEISIKNLGLSTKSFSLEFLHAHIYICKEHLCTYVREHLCTYVHATYCLRMEYRKVIPIQISIKNSF